MASNFFWVSSYNFFNNGVPHKFLWFLGSVLLALCNDTTFVEKTHVHVQLDYQHLILTLKFISIGRNYLAEFKYLKIKCRKEF